MISQSAIAAFVSALLLSLARCESISGVNFIFGIEYSEDGCGTSASAVSLVAYLVNETYTFVAPTSEELSCAQSTMCRINPSDDLCVGANEFPSPLTMIAALG